MSSATVNPSFYADFEGLTALKKNVKANDPQAIREAARQFESLFTDMMLKSMREAKLGEGLGDSDATDFYQDMYDQQLAVQMSEGKGLGLADMLVQQLTRSGAIKAATAVQGAAASAPAGAAMSSASRAPRGAANVPGAGAARGPATGRNASGAVADRQRISFIRSMQPYAQRAATQLGVSADSLIAQAALETGWGQHVPAASGGGSSHNLFGIKAGSAWIGAAVAAPTTEYEQGAASQVTQSFRAYSSLQQGVNDYVTLLQRDSTYQGALGTGEDVAAFAGALQRGGYASDPDYVQKLVATTASVKALKADAERQLGAAVASSAPLKLAAGTPINSGEEPA